MVKWNKIINRVSDDDIQHLSKLFIDELDQHVQRPPLGIEKGKKSAPKGNASHRADDQSTGSLPPDQLLYLKSVLSHPHFMVTARGKKLGFSTNKNAKIKKELVDEELIVELQLNFGPKAGGKVKFVELTDKGYRALNEKPPIKERFRCSAEHWFWQYWIHHDLVKQGHKAEIEMCRNGKRVDVGLVRGDKILAFEVGHTDANEAVNVVKDLEAGFHQVIVACGDKTILNTVQGQLQNMLTKEQWEHVTLKLVWEFSFVEKLIKANRTVSTNPLQGS